MIILKFLPRILDDSLNPAALIGLQLPTSKLSGRNYCTYRLNIKMKNTIFILEI